MVVLGGVAVRYEQSTPVRGAWHDRGMLDFRVLSFRGSGVRVLVSGFRVWGLGFRDSGLGFRVRD